MVRAMRCWNPPPAASGRPCLHLAFWHAGRIALARSFPWRRVRVRVTFFFENFKCAYDYLTAIPSMYGSAVLCDFVWAWFTDRQTETDMELYYVGCLHTCGSVTEQYNLVWANGQWCLAAGDVIAGLAEINSSLLPNLCLRSRAGWLPRTGISSGTL